MKKAIAFLLGLATIIGTSMPALAADQKTGEPILISANKSKSTINNNLIIAGKGVNIGNLRVVINNGNVMVPLKITAESLGFKVSADADKKVESKPIGMPNPIQEFNTVQEAQQSLKFETVTPKGIPSGFKIKYISTISKEIFQICYSNGENDILFRMGQGIDKIDGDYNEYKFNKTVQVNGKDVNLKGNNSNLVNLATYKINNMSYSISVTNGMEKDNIIKIIKSTF